MTTGKGEPGEPGQRLGGRPKRPPPTIDLQATEIPAASPAAPEGAAEAREEAYGEQPDPPLSPSQASEPHGSRVPPEGPRDDRSGTRPAAEAVGYLAWPSPDSVAWPIAAGAAGGAVLCSLLIGGLWLSGALHAPPASTAALADRIGAMEARVRELAQPPASGLAASLPPDTLRRLETAEQASRGMAAIESRLARAEQALAQAEKTLATTRPADAALIERLAVAEASARAATDRYAEVNRRLSEAEALARDARMRTEQTASSARETQRLAESVSAEASSDLTAVTNRLSALEERANELQRIATKAERSSQDPAARFALAAAMLRSAVESGELFSAELAAVRPFVSDPSILAPLAGYAEKGVPSLSMLRQSLRDVAARMAESRRQAVTQEGGLIDRLQIGAERLVRIRPAGEAGPVEDSGIVMRAQNLAGRDDLAGALAELAKLPPDLKALAGPWMTEAQARIDALANARRLSGDAARVLGQRP